MMATTKTFDVEQCLAVRLQLKRLCMLVDGIVFATVKTDRRYCRVKNLHHPGKVPNQLHYDSCHFVASALFRGCRTAS